MVLMGLGPAVPIPVVEEGPGGGAGAGWVKRGPGAQPAHRCPLPQRQGLLHSTDPVGQGEGRGAGVPQAVSLEGQI